MQANPAETKKNVRGSVDPNVSSWATFEKLFEKIGGTFQTFMSNLWAALLRTQAINLCGKNAVRNLLTRLVRGVNVHKEELFCSRKTIFIGQAWVIQRLDSRLLSTVLVKLAYYEGSTALFFQIMPLFYKILLF